MKSQGVLGVFLGDSRAFKEVSVSEVSGVLRVVSGDLRTV